MAVFSFQVWLGDHLGGRDGDNLAVVYEYGNRALCPGPRRECVGGVCPQMALASGVVYDLYPNSVDLAGDYRHHGRVMGAGFGVGPGPLCDYSFIGSHWADFDFGAGGIYDARKIAAEFYPDRSAVYFGGGSNFG